MTIPNQPVPAPPPPLPTAVYRPRASSPWHQAACIALTGLLYISLLAPVSYLLTPTGGWLVLYIVVGAAVLGLGAMARALGWRSGWTALAQLGLVLLIVELVAAWDRAWLGFIPNGAVIEQMGDLATSLGRSFLMEIAPLEPDRAALAFVALAGGMLAWAFDWYVFTVKAPAATGLFALLVVFVAVALVRDTMPMWPLVLVLLAYFALLTAVPAHTRPRFAGLGVVAASAVLALTAAAVIPGLGMGSLIRDGLVPNPGVRFAGGSDPLVDLGDDLRTGARYEVLRYTTSASQPIYLRLSTLGRFDGDTWTHSPGDEARFDDGLVLEDAVLPAGGMATVEIEILSLTSDNLPVPYQPVQVGSVEGRLVVDQDDLSITFRRGQLNRQSYWVDAWLADPNPIRSYTALPRPDSEYLELPDDLPNVIGLNARAATELATTPMEAARALENYFHTSGFRYSLTAPSQEGYDGDSAEVVAQFLEAKSGYCVHFAAAMTLMAREVGIPARIAVGYSPGRPVSNSGASTTFSVRADQLHAWPELWIDGIGWMGFEPTVSAGSAPRSTSASPSASPSAAASASATASTAASSPGATPSFTPSPTASSQNDAAGQAPPWPLIWAAVGLVGLALIGSMPWLVRAIIRRRRLGAGLAGVWREVHATAADLGLANPPWKTPAATAADLEVLLKAGGQAEAAAQVLELAGLVEATAYGPNRPDGETPAASVTELRRLGRGIVQGMTHSVTGRERWRGRLLPQTLFKRSGTGNYSTAPESRDEAD